VAQGARLLLLLLLLLLTRLQYQKANASISRLFITFAPISVRDDLIFVDMK
jgi:hypothetical protein